MNPACAAARSVLILALPVAAMAAPSFPMQFPSSTTPNVLPAALRPALDQALARDPDATWLEQKVISDDGQADDLFGFRVLVSGSTAFISAPAPIYRPGKVYVFANSGGTWTQMQTLTATPASPPPPNWSDFFGWSLSLSGDTLIIGAPFMLDQTLGPIGAAYVFTQSGGTWTQTQELTASDASVTDYFGWAVAQNNGTALIGANSHNRGANGTEGAAYVFVNSGSTWTQTQELEPSDGTPGDGRQFGSSVAFDGTTMLIGAPGADYNSNGVYIPGSAYVFENTGGTWGETEILAPDDGADGDQFGFAVAIAGTTLLIGAPAADIVANIHQGAAYVFDGSAGTFTETDKLVAADGTFYDQFGQSVAIQGAHALIGGWSHDDDPNQLPPPPKAGVAYLYTASRGVWSLSNEFTASDGTDGDSFGWDVALDGTTLLIGSQGTVSGNQFQGAGYFYTPTGPPIANISPLSMTFTLTVGATDSAPLTIGNSGGTALTYAITEAVAGATSGQVPESVDGPSLLDDSIIRAAGISGAGCSSPSDVPWLSESPTSGSVDAISSQDVTVAVDATALDPGNYSALLCVTTNDPINGLIAVPVSLGVNPNDTIFADGFDGAP
jgi:hypothetical protein